MFPNVSMEQKYKKKKSVFSMASTKVVLNRAATLAHLLSHYTQELHCMQTEKRDKRDSAMENTQWNLWIQHR